MQKGERGGNTLILALTRFTSREYKTPLMKHSLPTSSRCGTGVVLEGQEEYFVFFIAETGLYFIWLGDAKAKPDLPSFMLKVYLHQAGPDGGPREELGHYLSPHPARVMDVIHLCVISRVTNVNITQQSFYLRVLIEDRA
jgi:hypothetical protein